MAWSPQPIGVAFLTLLNETLELLKTRIASGLGRKSLSGRFVWGVMWSSIGSAASQILGFAASIVTARLLGTSGFGELGMVVSTVGMLGVFAGMGAGTTATRYLAELRHQDTPRAGRILALTFACGGVAGLAAASVLFVGAPFFATHVLAAQQLTGALRWGCALVLLNTISGVINGALVGCEAFRAVAGVSLARGLFGVIATSLGVWLWGLYGALGAMTLTATVECTVGQILLRGQLRNLGIQCLWRGCRDEVHVLWRFAIPAFLGNAMVGPVTWAAGAMLVNQPSGYKEMGVFNAANQCRTLLLFLPGILASVNTPVLSSLFGVGDFRGFRRVLVTTVKGTICITLPIIVLGFMAKDSIIGWYGAGFSDRGMVLGITLLTMGVLAIEIPFAQVMVAANRMWLGMLMNAGWGVAVLVTTWLLGQRHMGAEGLALAYLVSYLIHGLWTLLFAIRFFRQHLPRTA